MSNAVPQLTLSTRRIRQMKARTWFCCEAIEKEMKLSIAAPLIEIFCQQDEPLFVPPTSFLFEHSFLCSVFPQIAGSYRGSYFSMTGSLISEIAAWSPFPLRTCLPSLSPFMLPLPPCLCCSAAALPPNLVAISYFRFCLFLGYRCRSLSQSCLPSCFLDSVFGFSWLQTTNEYHMFAKRLDTLLFDFH